MVSFVTVTGECATCGLNEECVNSACQCSTGYERVGTDCSGEMSFLRNASPYFVALANMVTFQQAREA